MQKRGGRTEEAQLSHRQPFPGGVPICSLPHSRPACHPPPWDVQSAQIRHVHQPIPLLRSLPAPPSTPAYRGPRARPAQRQRFYVTHGSLRIHRHPFILNLARSSHYQPCLAHPYDLSTHQRHYYRLQSVVIGIPIATHRRQRPSAPTSGKAPIPSSQCGVHDRRPPRQPIHAVARLSTAYFRPIPCPNSFLMSITARIVVFEQEHTYAAFPPIRSASRIPTRQIINRLCSSWVAR